MTQSAPTWTPSRSWARCHTRVRSPTLAEGSTSADAWMRVMGSSGSSDDGGRPGLLDVQLRLRRRVRVERPDVGDAGLVGAGEAVEERVVVEPGDLVVDVARLPGQYGAREGGEVEDGRCPPGAVAV